MEFRGILRALRKGWWIILSFTAAAVLIGALATALTPAKYASTVTFFVRTPAEQINGAYQGDQFAQKRVNSYLQLAESQRLAALVKDESQTDLSLEEITGRITAVGDPNTVLMTITVTDTDPQRSLDLAKAVSTSFVSLVSTIETPPGASTPSVSLEVTSEATLRTSPVSPRPLINIGAALLAGLALGVAAAMLRELLDTSVRTAQELKRLTDAAVLAAIPFDSTAKESPLIVKSHSLSVRAEAFRQLRTNLQFVDVDHPVQVLVVTSSIPDEGKSSTATNLAVTFAEAGQKVLLIEGDLRRPRVADYLGLDGSLGLTNVLAGQIQVDEVLQAWGVGGLTVLPSGSIPPNPSELLGSQNMKDLLSALRITFQVIIIDTPPLLPVTDGAIAAASADGAMLVVRHGETNRGQVTAARAALAAVDARLIGTILNMVPTRGSDSYGYGSYASDYSSRGSVADAAEATVEQTALSEEAQALQPGAHRVSS